jgi:hypothetical protein
LLLGIQFRWLLRRGTLARTLVTSAELAIDDAKEKSWMETYEKDCDTLEDVLYQSINLLLFLQKQNLATAIYLFGLGTLLSLPSRTLGPAH